MASQFLVIYPSSLTFQVQALLDREIVFHGCALVPAAPQPCDIGCKITYHNNVNAKASEQLCSVIYTESSGVSPDV